MKIMTIIGVILIVLGAIGLIYGGISYTSNKNVMDVGPMHVEVQERNRIPLSPIAGAAALIAGVVLVVVDRRSSKGSAL